MPIEERWNVKRGAKIFSHLSFNQMKRLISKCLMKENDLIWRSGLSGWRKAGGIKDLKPLFQKLKKVKRSTKRVSKK